MSDEKLGVFGDGIKEVKESTTEVLADVFQHLKQPAELPAGTGERLFFPRGIELIDIKVNVSGIVIELKIAGPNQGATAGVGITRTLRSPQISFLDPREVPLNWEGTVKIFGSGFDDGSFGVFDERFLSTTFIRQDELHVAVTKETTGTAGTKTVFVHTGGGELSNQVDFVVRPGSEKAVKG